VKEFAMPLLEKNDRTVAVGDTVIVRGEVYAIDKITKEVWVRLTSGPGTGTTNPQPDAGRKLHLKACDVEKV
jgi:hypothetical protein